jgi:hypothetical protein
MLELPDHSRLEIVEHFPHARRDLKFTSDKSATRRDARNHSEPAALVEITTGDKTRQVWLRRNDPAYGRSTLTMPGGMLALSYEYESVPLDFSLELVDLHKQPMPGGAGRAAYSSKVRFVDSRRGIDELSDISVNRPFTHGSYRVYQSDSNQAAHGKSAANLLVSYDPGRTLKYGGSLLVGLGIVVMAATRIAFWRLRGRASLATSRSSLPAASNPDPSPAAMRPAA